MATESTWINNDGLTVRYNRRTPVTSGGEISPYSKLKPSDTSYPHYNKPRTFRIPYSSQGKVK